MTRCRGYGPTERYCQHDATTEGLCDSCWELRKDAGREALVQIRQQLTEAAARRKP